MHDLDTILNRIVGLLLPVSDLVEVWLQEFMVPTTPLCQLRASRHCWALSRALLYAGENFMGRIHNTYWAISNFDREPVSPGSFNTLSSKAHLAPFRFGSLWEQNTVHSMIFLQRAYRQHQTPGKTHHFVRAPLSNSKPVFEELFSHAIVQLCSCTKLCSRFGEPWPWIR